MPMRPGGREMSSRKKIDEDHKCVASKCKGILVDPPESYGHWAYWYGDKKDGWHSKPQKKKKQ
jgi:hypothetical protein